MHEYSFVENLIKSLEETIKKDNINLEDIKEIYLEVGEFEIHSSDAFYKAYEILSENTFLEGVKINLKVLEPYIECSKCGKRELELEEEEHHKLNIIACSNCGEIAEIKGGRGVGKIEVILK